MDKHFSLYLDLTRFTAAVLVVLSHFAQHGLFGDVNAHPLLLFGREAVIVFFVLSGLVIAWSTSTACHTLAAYAVTRGARIYSVVLPVLVLCFVLAAISGAALDHGPVSYQLNKPQIYLPLHLLFISELWNLAETPPWLVQYWSLGYEVWYYVLFGICH